MAAHTESADRDQQLNDILLSYIDALEEGRAPSREQLLADNPEFAEELADFLTSREQLERLAAPLRAERQSEARVVAASLSGAGTRIEPSALPASPATPPEAGCLGDFRLVREIGRGGMGIVYESLQISLNRRVALKVLPFAAALDPKHLQRFKNEAQAAAQLHHNNIVPVYAVGCERSVHYYAMQFIEGQSLAAVIGDLQEQSGRRSDKAVTNASSDVLASVRARAHKGAPAQEITASYAPPAEGQQIGTPAGAPAPETGPMPAAAVTERSSSVSNKQFFRRVAELGMRAAEALEHAHQLGVIHRDIKPANLLLDIRGNLWVTDFGLALFKSDSGLTMTGELLGTLRYMSPEQTFARRGLVDHRTDIYSLGATLYEFLTLEPVFSGTDRAELLHHIAYEEPLPPRSINSAIPIELETVILKALAKSPTERYASAQDLADDLKRYLEDKPILAKRPTVIDRLKKWGYRHRSVVASAAVSLVVLTLVLAGALAKVCYESAKAEAEHRKADAEHEKAEAAMEKELKSFAQAKKAVDFFTQVARDQMNDRHMRGVQKKLLEQAYAYYESFIQDHQDDPKLAAELTASQEKLLGVLERLGSPIALARLEEARRRQEQLMAKCPDCPQAKAVYEKLRRAVLVKQAGTQISLLTEPVVQHELGLCDEQMKKLGEQLSKLAEERAELCKETMQVKIEQHVHRILNAAQSKEQAVLAHVLSQKQEHRLWQIALQRQGAHAFLEPHVVVALALTPEQQKKIRNIEHEECSLSFQIDGRAAQVSFLPPSDDCATTGVAKVLEILTPEQRSKWRELVGRAVPGDPVPPVAPEPPDADEVPETPEPPL